jgi:hypothetical protein
VGFISNRILAFLLIALKTLPPEDRDHPSKPPFDMVYAHYAVMGGFAADVANLHNKLQRVTFTTEGILFLAKHGRFLDTSRSNIQDKSKADTLAKSLVCFQVMWVVGQAIERKVAGYPITLLELHTIVHVVCVIVMYGLWIRKPLNVQNPIVLNGFYQFRFHYYEIPNTLFGILYLEYSIWNTLFGILYLEYSIWNTLFGILYLEYLLFRILLYPTGFTVFH